VHCSLIPQRWVPSPIEILVQLHQVSSLEEVRTQPVHAFTGVDQAGIPLSTSSEGTETLGWARYFVLHSCAANRAVEAVFCAPCSQLFDGRNQTGERAGHRALPGLCTPTGVARPCQVHMRAVEQKKCTVWGVLWACDLRLVAAATVSATVSPGRGGYSRRGKRAPMLGK
jgi:hypothetical protein